MNTIERQQFIREQISWARNGRDPAPVPVFTPAPPVQHRNNGLCFSIAFGDEELTPNEGMVDELFSRTIKSAEFSIEIENGGQKIFAFGTVLNQKWLEMPLIQAVVNPALKELSKANGHKIDFNLHVAMCKVDGRLLEKSTKTKALSCVRSDHEPTEIVLTLADSTEVNMAKLDAAAQRAPKKVHFPFLPGLQGAAKREGPAPANKLSPGALPAVPTKPERSAESPPTPSGCSVSAAEPPSNHKSDVVRKIEAMDAKRVERRRRAAEAKCRREDDTTAAKAAGMGIECVDFLRLLAVYRGANGLGGEPEPCTFGTDLWASEGGSADIRVCVRKRPMLKLERIGHDFDVVDLVPKEATGSACSVALVVHEPKSRIDLTKAVDTHSFRFDGVFGEVDGNDRIHDAAVRPLVAHVVAGGVATVFAFGQTGSGKTCTMAGHGLASAMDGNALGLYALAAADVVSAASGAHLSVSISFFEIYGGHVLDLLSQRERREVQEDASGQMVIVALTELPNLGSATELLHHVALAQRLRAVGCTSANSSSSRSHAILSIMLREQPGGPCLGKLNLVDLAGSERAADSTSKERQTRLEGAEINKSLLCLKECIRALDAGSRHVPFRGSKLTMVLRDSFVGRAKTLMIATVAPGAAAADHTLNTLRYAQRVRAFSAKVPVLAQPVAAKPDAPEAPSLPPAVVAPGLGRVHLMPPAQQRLSRQVSHHDELRADHARHREALKSSPPVHPPQRRKRTVATRSPPVSAPDQARVLRLAAAGEMMANDVEDGGLQQTKRFW